MVSVGGLKGRNVARGKSKQKLMPVLVAALALLTAGAWWLSQQNTTPVVAPATLQAAAAAEVRTIRVATWNIKQFTDRPDLDLPVIAKIITEARFDVLAIQEVKKDGRAVDRLLATLGPPWRSGGISPMTGNNERFAIIYRGDRVQAVGSASFIDLADESVFDRHPYTARFRANRFGFQLVVVHLSYTDTGRRRLETQTLANCVMELAARQSEKDIIVLGDFNEQRARPNLPLMEDVGWHTTVSEATNLSSKEIYDNILIEPKHTTQWQGSSIVRFDELYFANDDRAASAAVSDHRPVYAEFKTDGPDND